MSDYISNVDEIFCAAIELSSPEERGEYVERACGGNAQLRHRVDALLAAHFGAGDFLERSPATALLPDHENAREGPGTLIGPYKLLEQIGEGGMGVVYMADQQVPVRRRVALKVIKTGMDTRQVIARFEAEREALALMDHSNIARVLDAGATESGRPYFVMELVRGIPITEYCDQNNLPVHERLELFVQVCHAVQHAHQKGIIHRDLKPSNVLVTLNDGRAVPKVIDFGVAKATGQQLTEKSLFTAFAQMVGTPLYMSPEQAEMTSVDIDTRSDIYSLGVLLYELLTGTTPFDQERMRSAAFDEIRRIIREEEPPKPSTRLSTLGETRTATAAHRQVDVHRLGRLLEGDLDWIVMKALEKDRTRRYDTAGNFAADVMRHLSDQPVEACPPSAAYRFHKFARRNKLAFIVASAAAVTLVLLVVGLVVSNRLIAAERNQKAAALIEKEQALAAAKASEEAARRNAERAEAESQRAEDNFLRASIAIREVLTKAALGLDEWSNLPAPLRKRFSEEAANFYRSLLDDDSPDPGRRYEAAVGYRAIAALHNTVGEHQQAEEPLRKSIAIFDQISTENPAVLQYRHQLAWSHLMLSRHLAADAKRRPEAVAEAHHARRLYEALLTAEPKDAKSSAVTGFRAKRAADDRVDKDYTLQHLAICHGDLANLDSKDGQLQDAEKNYRKALDIWGAQSDHAPMTIGFRWQIGHVQREYAFALQNAGRLEEAEKVFGEALDVFAKLTIEKPDTAENWGYTADTQLRIAKSLMLRGQHQQGEKALQQSIENYEQCLAKFPNYAGNRNAADCYNELAWFLATSPVPQQRDPAHAVELAKKAVEIQPTASGCWNTLGVAQYRNGEWNAAVEALGKSMKLRASGDSSNWYFLAMAHWQLGHKNEARNLYKMAVESMDKNQPKNEELLRFRNEAAELLGISEPAKSTDSATKP